MAPFPLIDSDKSRRSRHKFTECGVDAKQCIYDANENLTIYPGMVWLRGKAVCAIFLKLFL